MDTIKKLKSQMRDLVSFYDRCSIVEDVNKAIDGDPTGMMYYGMDLRRRISEEHTLDEKIKIISDQIEEQCSIAMGDFEKMKDTINHAGMDYLVAFTKIDNW